MWIRHMYICTYVCTYVCTHVCMYACMCVYVCMTAECSRRLEEDIGPPRTGITDGCESPCRCQEPNPGPQGEQPVL